MKLKQTLLALPLALSLSFSAHANLITNSSFETGDLTGWTVLGSGATDINTLSVHTGTYAAQFNGGNNLSIITQAVATTVGHTYNLQFWLNAQGNDAGSNTFDASWNYTGIPGGSWADINPSNAFPYTLMSYTLTATSTSSIVGFAGLTGGSYFIDDISLTDVTVPEAPEWLLTLSGLSALAFAKKRKAA